MVSALNNNLLFREISPMASQVEEMLTQELATQLGLPASTSGVWCSGGSLANLTGMFAAAGGYSSCRPPRQGVTVFMGERSHASITKGTPSDFEIDAKLLESAPPPSQP